MPGHAGSSQSSGGAPRHAALNSTAPQRAALSGPLQTLVEDVKQFGRIPKRKKGTSEQERAENKLAKRFSDCRDSIPKDVLHELRALGRASQPADDEQLVAEASDPEHLPPEVDTAALMQAVRDLGHYPILGRQIVCLPNLWDFIGQEEPAVEKLLKDVLYFGRLPHHIKKPTTEPERREHRLALRIAAQKKKTPRALWELIVLHCAHIVTVNGVDEDELCFACDRIMKDRPSTVTSLSFNHDSDSGEIHAPTAEKWALLAKACPNLIQFRVEDAIFHGRSLHHAVQATARACPKLLRLDLGGNLINDGALQIVSQACPLLENLDVHHSGIGDVAIQAVAQRCARLEELNVDECANLTDAAFLAVAQGCPRLRTLTIWSSCPWTDRLRRPKVTDAAICALGQQCPHIEILEMCGLESLTDAAIQAVAIGCPSLKELDASLCCQLTDAAVQSLAHHSSSLSILKLRDCANITTSGVSALAQITAPLEYLDVRPIQLSREVLCECVVRGRDTA